MTSIVDHNGSPIVDLNTKKHVSESVYWCSAEFNALRKELFEEWSEAGEAIGRPNLWAKHGWKMAFQPDMFVVDMCSDLGLVFTGFDSGKEAEICLRFLNALREKRGLSSF